LIYEKNRGFQRSKAFEREKARAQRRGRKYVKGREKLIRWLIFLIPTLSLSFNEKVLPFR
jgi:hypothetical protein